MFQLAIYQCNMSIHQVQYSKRSHTTSSLHPSPPTNDSLSLHHLGIQGGHLHSIFQLFNLFFGLLLLKSNGKVVKGIISTVFLGSHNNSNCSQTHRSMGHCTCRFIANPVLKPEVCRRPGSVHHNLNELSAS